MSTAISGRAAVPRLSAVAAELFGLPFCAAFFNVTYCQVQGFFAMALLFAAIGFAFRPLHRHAGLLMTLYRLVRLMTLYRLGYHYD